MREIVRYKARLIVCVLLVATCAQGQTARQSWPPIEGSEFVAQLSARGQVDRVYIFGGDSHVVCLDGTSGLVIWSVKAPGLADQPGPGADPVIAGSTVVYMGGGGFLEAYALDSQTGKTKWTLARRSRALAADDRRVFLASEGGSGVTAVDAETGRINWEHEGPRGAGFRWRIVYAQGRLYSNFPDVRDADTGQIVATLPVNPDNAIVRSGKLFVAGNGALLAIDSPTGKTLWTAMNPLPHSHRVYLAGSDHYVLAAFYDDSRPDASTGIVRAYASDGGRMLWERSLTSSAGLPPEPLSADDQFAYLLEPNAGDAQPAGKITAFDVRTGRQVWTFLAPRLYGPLALAGDTVLVNSDAGSPPEYTTLYAVDRKTGSTKWRFSF